MKTQITSFILFWTIYSFNINAQVSNIDYNAYRLPEVKFRALSGYGGIGGNVNNSRFNALDKERTFSNGIAAHYRTFNYNATKQAESSLSFSHSLAYKKVNLIKETKFEPSASYSNFDRTFDKKNNFFEWGTNTYLNGNFENENDERSRNYGSNIQFSVLLGHGRIEPITTVFIAKFIVDELLKEVILLEELDQEMLFALADQIAILQNKRVFDTRIYRKFVIKNLAEWMLANTKIDSSKIIDLTTTISDNWIFANIGGRSTGKSISYGLEPSYVYNYSKQPFGIQSEYNQLGLNGVINYSYYRQKSQYTQRSFEIETNINVNSSPLQKFELSTFTPNVNLSYGIGYYPNSRTNIYLNAGIYASFSLTRFKDIEPIGSNYFSLSQRISMNYDYFINYNFKLYGYLFAYHSNSYADINNLKSTNVVANFGMSYIFY